MKLPKRCSEQYWDLKFQPCCGLIDIKKSKGKKDFWWNLGTFPISHPADSHPRLQAAGWDFKADFFLMLNTEIPRLPHKKLGRWFLKLFTNSTSSAPHLRLLQDPKFSSAVWMERLEHEFLYLIISLFQLLLGFPATPTTILMSSTLPIACQETLKEIKLKHSPHGKHRRGKNRRAWMGKRLRRNS